MNTREDYIGVFDSGVGGISVLRQLRNVMPKERFLYFGDSANAPYGTRPRDEIRELTLNVAAKLMDRGLKALVVACNTATAAAIEDLRKAYPDMIVIGIEPALKPACDRFPGQTVGVMATPATLREEKLARLMEHCASQCRVIITFPSVSCQFPSGKTIFFSKVPLVTTGQTKISSPSRNSSFTVSYPQPGYPYSNGRIMGSPVCSAFETNAMISSPIALWSCAAPRT